MIIPETTRLKRDSTGIEVDFVDAVHTPVEIMEYAIQLHLAGLSLKKIVIAIEQFGVSRTKSTIHNWVQKADLEPRGGCAPDRVALDETEIKVEGEQYCFVAAVELSTNRILHAGLYSRRNMAITGLFLDELDEKHEVRDAEFHVDGAPWPPAGLHELGVHFLHETLGDRNPVERVFQEIKRRSDQFYNHFGDAAVETVENWLLALAWAENTPI